MNHKLLEIFKTQMQWALFCFLSLMVNTWAAAPTPVDCRVQGAVAPLHVDTLHPRFSWEGELRSSTGIQNQLQSAYEISVSQKGGGAVWNSGKVNSDQQMGVRYAGSALKPFTAYSWKVRIWNQKGEASSWSADNSFETAALTSSDWNAKWIGATDGSMKMLRTEFKVADKKVKRARVFVSGVGYYELRMNGAKVGDHVLEPGYTGFTIRSIYSVYDVGDVIQKGTNGIGIMLGNGFAWGKPKAGGNWYVDDIRLSPRAFFQMLIEYEGGTQEWVSSNSSWKGSKQSPITYDNIFDGEEYDARLWPEGWDKPGFSGGGWSKCFRGRRPCK